MLIMAAYCGVPALLTMQPFLIKRPSHNRYKALPGEDDRYGHWVEPARSAAMV